MNFDTSKSSTLFEAQNRMLMVEGLKSDNRIPVSIINDLLENSPISSFYIQPFQISIWKDLFKLRNHPVLNDFLAEKFNQGITEDIASTFGDPEKFANEFRNDLLSFIFQNNLRAFNISNIKSYKGYGVDKVTTIEKVKSLSHGAFVKDGILYVDEKQLRSDFSSNAYSTKEYSDKGLAKVSPLAFDNENEFFKFVFERENLRSVYPLESIRSGNDFSNYYNVFSDTVKQLPNESKEQYDLRKPGSIYEMWLRDKALDNIYNGWKLFRSDDTYADQFFRIMDEFPEVKSNYSIATSLSLSEAKGYTNLRLKDTSLDADKINILHENLLTLSDRNVKKVDNQEDNNRISDFFSRFPIIAFLQSGLNTKSSFSMVRIVPQDRFIASMELPVDRYTKNLNSNILQTYYDKFIVENNNRSRSRRVRYKDYTVPMTLEQSMTHKPSMSEANDIQTLIPYDSGVVTYDQNKLGKNTDKLLLYNPDTIFVFNGATESMINPIKLDYFFSTSAIGNKLSLPTRRKYSGGKLSEEYKDEVLLDGSVTINPILKQRIDDAISNLKELQDSGKVLAFNSNGYGQYMIGADPATSRGATLANAVSPVSFLYLSQQLFKNFGFVNPNYDRTKTGKSVIQASQPISDEVVRDMMNHCFLT